MVSRYACLLLIGLGALPFAAGYAESAQEIVQQFVDAEHAADENDHSQWVYLEESRTPKGSVVQWVASTRQGNVFRVLEENGKTLSPAQQETSIQKFLRDPEERKKQIAETNHDLQQIDDLLRLLPKAFVWTKTGETSTAIFLHFEPDQNFHPPTREARILSSMVGDVIVDKQQHRLRSMSGHLVHDVTFGGGILGRLKAASSFSLDQEQVGPFVWQLTEFHVGLDGKALLLKSISLHQDDKRFRFRPEAPAVTLDQAASAVMGQPETVQGPSGADPH